MPYSSFVFSKFTRIARIFMADVTFLGTKSSPSWTILSYFLKTNFVELDLSQSSHVHRISLWLESIWNFGAFLLVRFLLHTSHLNSSLILSSHELHSYVSCIFRNSFQYWIMFANVMSHLNFISDCTDWIWSLKTSLTRLETAVLSMDTFHAYNTKPLIFKALLTYLSIKHLFAFYFSVLQFPKF